MLKLLYTNQSNTRLHSRRGLSQIDFQVLKFLKWLFTLSKKFDRQQLNAPCDTNVQ